MLNAEKRSFVQDRIAASKRQKRAFDLATAGTNDDTKRAFAHLLGSTSSELRQKWEGVPWIPLPYEFLRPNFPKADFGDLVASGVVEIRDADRHRQQCREYRAAPAWYTGFIANGPDVGPDGRLDLIDLLDGGAAPRRHQSRTTDENRHQLPQVVRAGIKAIGSSEFNLEGVQGVLRKRREEAEAAPGDITLLSRFLADSLCLQAVMRQRPKVIGTVGGATLMSYQAAYKSQMNGRVSEIGGGLQSCTREMKAAAREGVPGFRNYDLASAHPRILSELMERVDIDPAWLQAYLADPMGKVTAANAVGIDVDVWKEALYAYLNGAHLPEPANVARAQGDLVDVLRAAVRPEQFHATYTRFYDYVADLRGSVGAFQRFLRGPWVKQTGVRTSLNGGRTYVRNAAGMSRAIEDMAPSGNWMKLTARLVAFVLQGEEANVVHRIAASHEEYGFTVMANEHDGLITKGEIPDACVRAAALAAGLRPTSVVLKEKPLL